MNKAHKLKNTDKVEAVKAFLNIHKITLGNENTFYDPKSVAHGIADFLELDFIGEDKPMEVLENIALGYAQENQTREKLKVKSKELRELKKIDFSKTTNSDLVDDALQPIRGMMTILSSMALSTRGGDDAFQSQAYDVLHNICNGVLDKFEELKSEIDYMEDVIRAEA